VNWNFRPAGSTYRDNGSSYLTRTFIAGIAGTPVTGAAVFVDDNGQLGVALFTPFQRGH